MIDEMREQGYSLKELSEAFHFSRSSYYAARSAPKSSRSLEEETLVEAMENIHADRHTRSYGSPRMATELQSRGLSCSENRAARLMKKQGISARRKAAFRPKTTINDPSKKPPPNHLKTRPAPSAPGEIFVSDITYVATREGWLYLAVVLDLYSRKVAGWALADHMETSLVTTAFGRATSTVAPCEGALFHSDRGCQYTSKAMRSHITLLGLTQSMSAKGYCYDNAANESFFATLKREAFPEGCCFDTKADARRAIFDYLQTFYNKRRRHSALGNISPEEFINRHFQKQKTHLN